MVGDARSKMEEFFGYPKLRWLHDCAKEEEAALSEGWHQEWYEADFSWEGLARKSLVVRTDYGKTYELCLQDYWRMEEESLITAPNGKRYTRFHLPFEVLVNGNYVVTEKAGWSPEVWTDLYNRLRHRLKSTVVEIRKDKISRQEEAFRPADPPKSDGVYRDLRAIQPDLSGLHLPHYIPELHGDGENIIVWSYFKAIHFTSHSHNGELKHGIRLRNCLVDEIKIIEQSGNANILLDSCKIKNDVNISSSEVRLVSLRSCNLSYFDFNNTTIEQLVLQSDIRLPQNCSLHHISIKQDADFRGSGFSFINAFYTAKIRGRLLIDQQVFGRVADKVFEQDVINPALWASHPNGMRFDRERKSRLFAAIEGGALILKTKMREEQFEELAHRFYRYELWARTHNPYTEFSTRLLLTFYRWCSQYGYNITRPILWTLYLSFALATPYLFCFTWSQGWTIDLHRPSLSAWLHFDEAWSFSLGRVAPVIPWNGNVDVVKGSFEHSLKTARGLPGLIVHFMGVTQTVLSTCLFFLSALAARRRLKMSD